MALSKSPIDDVSDGSRLVTPSWVTPALFALWGGAAIAEILMGHVITGVVIAAGTAVTATLAIIFRRSLTAFNRRRAASNQAAYGSLSLIGLGWMLLGLWQLVSPPSDVVLGGVCVGVGLIMVLAYAPAFFQRRSLDHRR